MRSVSRLLVSSGPISPETRTTAGRPFAAFALIISLVPAGAAAQGTSNDLGQATLEDLMNIRVTSAARRSQRVEDVAAAVYVITADDIRRSGLTSLPEILRLAPGVQVARISASKWAVSIRGFNDIYSNKLLVLLDGRSVYTRTFSGVWWEMQDLILSDIERIEIIRGPGGAVWGANAVNGIINIISRTAAETQGLSVTVSAGTFERERGAIRYGGTAAGAAYRLFGQWTRYDDADPSQSTPYSDRWHSLTSGFRIDSSHGSHTLLSQGHLTTNRTRPGMMTIEALRPDVAPTYDGVSRSREASILGRWTHRGMSGSSYQLQAYYTYVHRDEAILTLSEQTTDVETQYETRLGLRHGIVVGGGYRHIDLSSDDTLTLQVGSHRLNTASAFIQDEIGLPRDLTLTAGARLEYDSYGGWGLLPSARLVWEASAGQRVWAATSRARRTPSIVDRHMRYVLGVIEGPGLPIIYAFLGNSAGRSEELIQSEAGYRRRLGSHASFEATGFIGSYDHLPTGEPFAPLVELTPTPAHLLVGGRLDNLRNARTSGVELNTRWSPAARVDVEASYSFLHLTTDTEPESRDTTRAYGTAAPAHQWQVRSTATPWSGFEIGAAAYRVNRLQGFDLPGYTRVDVRADVKLRPELAMTVVAQNILSRHEREFAPSSFFRGSRMPRAVRLQVRWGL